MPELTMDEGMLELRMSVGFHPNLTTNIQVGTSRKLQVEVQCDATPLGAKKKAPNSCSCLEPKCHKTYSDSRDLLNLALASILRKTNWEICDEFFSQQDIDQAALTGLGRCAVCCRPASNLYIYRGCPIHLCEGANAWLQTRLKEFGL